MCARLELVISTGTTTTHEVVGSDDEDGDDEGILPRFIDLIGASVLLGRSEVADVFIDSIRLPRMVSREHAELTLDVDGRGWLLRDLGGPHNAMRHNGTAVNGVSLGMGGSVRLHDGDVLRLGRKQSEVCYRLVSTPAPDEEVGDFDSGSSQRL